MPNKVFSSNNSKVSAVLASLMLLSACNSTGDSSAVDNALEVKKPQNSQLQVVDNSRPLNDEIQDSRAFCPRTILREGTQTYDAFTQGIKADDAGASQELRYRATISEHVRECNSAGEFLNIDVGIKGRIISGPKGQGGAYILPLRVVVIRGSDLLYEKTHEVWSEILPGRTNGSFAFVDKTISILKPQSTNIQIFVGFDEGDPNKKEDASN
ncbi:MAG: hypothetical protein AB8B49_10780 [Nitratireductor sp.]